MLAQENPEQDQDQKSGQQQQQQQTSQQDQRNGIGSYNAPPTDPLNDHDYCSPHKSQWTSKQAKNEPITPDANPDGRREKRQRKEVYDPEFSHFTSSDYSSSDADSGQDSDQADSEDDPDRLWCSCQKKFDGQFMICCDICEFWYHGSCVGVVEKMSKKWASQKKEWFCPDCREQLESGAPRNAIPKKVVKKEKKKTRPGRRRGRPRKSEESATRFSLRNARKNASTSDPKLKRSASKLDARSESYDEFENNERLKELIRERKKEFFFKRSLAEQQKAAKMRELGISRQSVTTPSLGSSLDSLASSTSTPNMSNLPINIKSEHKERPKSSIVLQINTKKDGASEPSSQRIVTTIVKSKKRKASESTSPGLDDLFTAEPIHLSKKVHVNSSKSHGGDSKSPTLDHKATNIKSEKNLSGSESSSGKTTPRKKRKDSESSSHNGAMTPMGSKQVAQKIKENLETRCKQIKDLDVPVDEIGKIAAEIEAQLNECYKEGSPKYRNKFRSLIFNLMDTKNEALVRNVLKGDIQPDRLVRMSPDEMASSELAKWRERENKHSIELIKRDAELAAQQVIVKKTHKGEEVISTVAVTDPNDPTVKAENNENPTTSTQSPVKEPKMDHSRPSLQSNDSSSVDAPTSSSSQVPKTIETNQDLLKSSTPTEECSSLFDTTNDHKNHAFSMNCKICTQQKIEDGTSKAEKQNGNECGEQSSTVEPQPKRFRVSIDTKLDPANLLRLKEPLVKPIDTPDEVQYSPSKVSFEDTNSDHEEEDEDEEELYDPEQIPDSTSSTPEKPLSQSHEAQDWSGTITMPDVGKFSARATPVSGNFDFMKEEVNQNLVVCGRIAPDQISVYIKKLKSTTRNQIILVQLRPLTPEDTTSFDTLFDYLYSRNRCGVVNTSSNSYTLKDFYILPIHEKSSIPEILKPINGPGLDRKEPNCLLGLLVKIKQSNSVAGSSSTSISVK